MDNSVHIVGNNVPAPKRQAKPSGDINIPMTEVNASSGGAESSQPQKIEQNVQPQVESKQMSYAEISSMLSKVNIYLDQFEIQANYQIDQVTGSVHIEIVNSTSGEVLRRIPPYKALEVISNIEMTGQLLNQEA